jgi:hypothetical protein
MPLAHATDPAVREALARVTVDERSHSDTVLPADPEVLRGHGVLDASTQSNLRRTVLSEIVLPCARALVSSLPLEAETADFEIDIPTA